MDRPLVSLPVRLLLVVVFSAIVSGCSGRYFRAAEPPDAVDRYTLAELPQSEYWTGIVFNGAKIGFAHTRISPLSADEFEIRSEASLLFRFLGFEKRIRLQTVDVVSPDLSLRRFLATHHIDGNDLQVSGEVAGNELHVRIVNAGELTHRSYPVEQAIYPTSTVLLYPATRGLEVGRTYRYPVFNTETQRISDVEQRIVAFQSSELFDGEAYRIVTRLQGQNTTSWVDRKARPLFELALNGVMIAALEDEATARRYLAAASLNKQDVMLEFSLVRPDRAIADPRRATAVDLVLQGVDAPPVSGPGQACELNAGAWRCSMQAGQTEPLQGDPARHMQSSLTVPWGHPEIRSLAGRIADASMPAHERVRRILDWLDAHIRKEPVDAFSALDVLRNRRAECQGHAYLYTALARALGLPTRVANGLVYSEQFHGFLYHSWAESLVDGQWIAVDPTFSQPVADATHIKLLEGEELADLVALSDWIGRISIQILDARAGP